MRGVVTIQEIGTSNYRRLSRQVKVRELFGDTDLAPDQLDPSLFVICQKDPDSGEFVPAMRHSAKWTFERGRDGSCQEIK